MNGREHTVRFTTNVLITLSDGTELDVGTHEYKAYYNEYADGVCHVTEMKRLHRGGDPSKDSDWSRDNLGYNVVRALEHELEDAVRREQQRLVESYDEEMRRFG